MQTDTNAKSSNKLILEKHIIIVAQLLAYPLLLLLRLIVARKPKYAKGFRLTKCKVAYVLYANHQSKLDPLIICASLPLKTITKLLPFRFFIENLYFRSLLGPVLRLMGGFPAHYDASRPYGLDRANNLLTNGQTVVIFPQGKRTREHTVKAGVSSLALAPEVLLVPVYINWTSRLRCWVIFGEPIAGGPKLLPEELMQRVYALENQV